MKRFPILKSADIYHIFNRGISKNKIFTDEISYRFFLLKLAVYRKKYAIKLIAFCVMPSHFHVLIYTKEKANNIPKFMQSIQHSYSLFFNHRNNHSGHVFQGTYNNKNIHPFDTNNVISYILQNPVKEKFVKRAEDWPYSGVYMPGIHGANICTKQMPSFPITKKN